VHGQEIARIDRLTSEALGRVGRLGKAMEDSLHRTIAAVLERFALPSRDDVSRLAVRLETLNAKIQALKSQQRRPRHGR
jgi:hypothetical protein